MSTPNHQPEETDILVLLDYFKNGLKTIVGFIQLLLQKVFNLIIGLLLLIKKNIILFAISILGFLALWYYITNSESWKNYGYELIVEPNFDSTEALYSQISSLNSSLGSAENPLLLATIKPQDSYKEKIDAYYNTLDDNNRLFANFKTNDDRDTIFFREIEINDFIKDVPNYSYKKHVISLKSSKKLTPKQIINLVITPVIENKDLVVAKNSHQNSLQELIDRSQKTIGKIDTLLKDIHITKTQNPTINLEGNSTKNNVEADLLNNYNDLNRRISEYKYKLANNSQIIKITSEPKSVEPKRKIQRSPFVFALIGFSFMLIILLFIRFYKYLNVIEKKKKS